ncbi:hypothetical protein CPB83DRAFT_113437 [Crepidotus variabilis]|uniref:DUF7330 domain-containing protein n=1 Tax=Crepidotus variabilis TaxID=179855 RepID=A0A9P6E4M4_9AGAR|nr:hypothetical protein CPB83DRAFT_113437 [Crepidotus variabilis]
MQNGPTTQTPNASSDRAAYLPSGIRPSNFVKIHRKGQPISGAFVIDRNMKFPDKEGWHLSLVAGYGSIDADVFTVPPSASATEKDRQKRTTISISGGTILVHFHRPQTSEDSYPFYITLSDSQNSASVVSLPRSFRGHAEISSKVTFSPDMLAKFTLFGEEDGVTKGFIGDFDHTQWKGIGQWEGDLFFWQPSNKVSSTLTLRYDDEGL